MTLQENWLEVALYEFETEKEEHLKIYFDGCENHSILNIGIMDEKGSLLGSLDSEIGFTIEEIKRLIKAFGIDLKENSLKQVKNNFKKAVDLNILKWYSNDVATNYKNKFKKEVLKNDYCRKWIIYC